MDVSDDLGGVDVTVNNAGLFGGGEFLSVSEDEPDQRIAINVKGVFFATQVAAGRT